MIPNSKDNRNIYRTSALRRLVSEVNLMTGCHGYRFSCDDRDWFGTESAQLPQQHRMAGSRPHEAAVYFTVSKIY